MQAHRTTIYSRVLAAGLLVAAAGLAVVNAQTPDSKTDLTEAASEARGVEMSQTSSVVQRGVKRGSQLSLEKTLDLIAQPRAGGGGGGGSRSAAGIGGSSGRPAGGGSGDREARNRMQGNVRQMMNTGS